MDLKTYVSDTARRQALADALGNSPMYLWQLANGWRNRRPSPALALAIERETKRLGPATVRKETLRPDVWARKAKAA